MIPPEIYGNVLHPKSKLSSTIYGSSQRFLDFQSRFISQHKWVIVKESFGARTTYILLIQYVIARGHERDFQTKINRTDRADICREKKMVKKSRMLMLRI